VNGAPSLREKLAVLWQGLLGFPRAVLLIGWLWVRQRPAHRRALRMLRRALARPLSGDEPLRPLEPGLFDVAPKLLDTQELPPDALTVVHLLGTGENRYSPLTGLVELCKAEPRLRGFRHVILDTPHDAGAFLGPHEFATRAHRVLLPLLARNRDRIVLIGLSRGATSALDLGLELAAASGTRVGVLAMAPPLARSGRPPPTVVNIGALEPNTENFVRQIELAPWLAPLGVWLLRDLYLRFSSFVLAELSMVSEASIALFARYVATSDPQQACLRAVREFALLGRVSDAELRHVVSGAMQRLAVTDAAYLCVCWGSCDAWVELEPSRARLIAMRERHEVPAERLRISVLPGVNHGVGREPDQDFAALAALCWEVCEHALSSVHNHAANAPDFAASTESTP